MEWLPGLNLSQSLCTLILRLCAYNDLIAKIYFGKTQNSSVIRINNKDDLKKLRPNEWSNCIFMK